jgi:hypothetical protein
MDIRQNPINPAAPAPPPSRADLPPSAGPAALAPVAPGLPSPIPSVVALSEAARSLAARAPSAHVDGESADDADFAAAQLELMLALIRVYTPPPPLSPQELAESVAAEVAAERERLAPADDDPALSGPAAGDAPTAAAVSSGEASAEPFAAEDVDGAPIEDEAAAPPGRPPVEAAEQRRAQRYSASEAADGPVQTLNVSA